jgi:hypothetical protein
VIVIAHNSVKANGVSKDDLKDLFTGNATTQGRKQGGARPAPRRTGDLF